MAISPAVAEAVYQRSDCLFDRDQVQQAFDRLAAEIESRLKGQNPLFLCVMTGGMVPASELLMRMDFPLELDYVHATRYGSETSGKTLQWLVRPRKSLQGRRVLVVDDILDEGLTLGEIVAWCKEQGAQEVLSAVLVDKDRPRSGLAKADFTGLVVPDRYVFGCGMDYKGYLRNVPGIFAAQKDDE